MTDVTGYTKAGADAAFATAAQLAGKVDSSALATVATTGSYSDLANIPASVPTTWDSVTGKPTFSTVATSGSYTDLANKPTIPAAQVQTDWNASSGLTSIANKPTLGTAAAQPTTAFATAVQGNKADAAVPQAVASGASAVRIIGYGTTLPGTATAGDVFFLQGT